MIVARPRTIELPTHREDQVLRLEGMQKFPDGDGYRAKLTVRSGGFGCSREFFFDVCSLVETLDALRRMDAGQPGSATLRGLWDRDHIDLEMNRRGHVTVSGELFESSEPEQMLRFAFQTDQTVLRPLLDGLQANLGA